METKMKNSKKYKSLFLFLEESFKNANESLYGDDARRDEFLDKAIMSLNRFIRRADELGYYAPDFENCVEVLQKNVSMGHNGTVEHQLVVAFLRCSYVLMGKENGKIR